jgi:hypothetical protein
MMLLLLGAGASKSFGIPDTKGFVLELEQRIGSRRIYQMLKNSLPEGFMDMEVLMTVFNDLSKDKEELLEKMAPHTAHFLLMQGEKWKDFIESADVKMDCHDMLRETKKTIRTKCLSQVRDRKADILKDYDLFWNNLNCRTRSCAANDGSEMVYPSFTIFTTNYDTCVETYFNERQLQVARGIVERYGEHVFDVSTLPLVQQNSVVNELIKLHGSIDLFVKDKRIRLLPGAGAMDTSAITFLGAEYGPEFMIYPVESSTSTELVQSPFIEQLYIFRNRLAINRSWIIVGSTFRDLTLASIMNDVLVNKNKGAYPTVLHINPEATKINEYLKKKRYDLLAGIIKPIDGCFIDDKVGNELQKTQLL